MIEQDPPDESDDELRWQLQSLERVRREGERVARLREQHDFSALHRRLRKQFTSVVVPELRARGFRGRVPHLHRVRGEALDILMLQVDKYGGGFTVNLGRARADRPQPASVRLIDLPLEDRARITRDPTGEDDLWFRYDGRDGTPEAQQDQALNQVASLLDDAERWWRNGHHGRHIIAG